MGCGSSSTSPKYPKEDYYNRGEYRNNPQYNDYRRQEQDLYRDGRNYYDDDVRNKTLPKPSEMSPIRYQQSGDSGEEDETPYDDDGVADNKRYTKNNVGLLAKECDFRTKYLDEEPEQIRVSPGKLYLDPDFTPDTAVVQDRKDVKWKRPQECFDNPKLFTGGANRFDIGQGTVGTCWFLSAARMLVDREDMLNLVIPPTAYPNEDQNKYNGSFQPNLFDFGKWKKTVTDDLLPFRNDNRLYSAKSASDEREMWVPLLEKAFAKLLGSYDAAYRCQPGDACLLLTGGVGEHIDLSEYKQEDKLKVLFDTLKNRLSSRCYIVGIVRDEYDNQNGLVGGQPYSLTDVYENKGKNVRLVRLKNPLEQGEWKGPWSDGSSEWSTIPQNSAPATKKDDGEFYMSLQDFVKYFPQITVCSTTPSSDCDEVSAPLNYVLSIYGEWQGKTAAGFNNLLQNQRFTFTVTNEGLMNKDYMPLVIQIVQQRKKGKAGYLPVRCDVFKVLGDKISSKRRCVVLKNVSKNNNVYAPQLQSVSRYKLTPGRYVVIASTAEKSQEKAFLLRLFSPVPLQNVKEIPIQCSLVSCENESTIDANGKTYQLTYEKTLFGEFIARVNAGGQASNQSSYHTNPQYLVTIPDSAGSRVPLVIHVLQTHEEPQYPVGIRIFQLDKNTQPPVDNKYLYNHFDECPKNLDGSQSKFIIAWDVDAKYLLQPGKYLALVHLDQPNSEKSFSITFKSTVSVTVKGYQTG